MLPFENFLQVVANAPLVSMDLIIENQRGEVLVGLRNNEPAAGFWFVPGGRVLKDERLDQAFLRISRNELGVDICRQYAESLGVYEHFYDTNAGSAPGFGTHYVVLAYRLRMDAETLHLPIGEQHEQYRWILQEQAREDTTIHPYSRAYFA
ncbi:MAG: GDP-mannose mannosyl hydrolase [Formivibrio sp.]|nr:GDP-mannose mannosyl hydrolase [Formivibrio sp.]